MKSNRKSLISVITRLSVRSIHEWNQKESRFEYKMLHNQARLIDVDARTRPKTQPRSAARRFTESPTRRHSKEVNELDWYHTDRLTSPSRPKVVRSTARLAPVGSPELRLGPAEDYEQNDENSSISYAQSGSHSMLSGWRLKQQQAGSPLTSAKLDRRRSNRPNSVLSNSSSVATKRSTLSKFLLGPMSRKPTSSAAIQRIPLGPKSAQHFVTNTRRRRRANELILEALDARRRAIAANRQNSASFYGSASYLGPQDQIYGESQLVNRLSLSPSPILIPNSSGAVPTHANRKTPSPAPRRTALSDLGVSRQAAQLSSRVTPEARRAINANVKRVPTLAKLDQNSSDLCTSNSSSGSSSQISSSDESQFTQLVTSELVAPDYMLQDEYRRLANEKTNMKPKRPDGHSDQAPIRHHDNESSRVAKRSTSEVNRVIEPKNLKRSVVSQETTSEQPQTIDRDMGPGLKRDALNRDSIRRLRLSGRRAPQPEQPAVSSPSKNDTRRATQESTRPQTLLSHSGRSRSFDEATIANERESRRQSRFISPSRTPVREQSETTKPKETPSDSSANWRTARQRSSISGADLVKESNVSILEMEKILEQLKTSQLKPIKSTETLTTSRAQFQMKKESRSVLEVPASTYFTVRQANETQPITRLVRVDAPNSSKPAPPPRPQHPSRLKTTETRVTEESRSRKLLSSGMVDISPPPEFADPKPPPTLAGRVPATDYSSVLTTTPQPSTSNRDLTRTATPPKAPKTTPKFEKTGDDELRKRVDQLRRLARSQSQPEGDLQAKQQMKLVKPLSTNWKPENEPAKAQVSREAIEKPRPISPKPRLGTTQSPTTYRSSLAATTNLDTFLLPPPVQGSSSTQSDQRWRKSSPSLAAFPSRSQSHVHQPPSTISNFDDEPRQESQVMKLVVREKSAPRLNYAVVEKQSIPQVQEAREVFPRASRLQPSISARKPQPIVVASGPLKCPVPPSQRTQREYTPTSGNDSNLASQEARPIGTSNRTNSLSTNDDSAIASSISSPSLSSNMISMTSSSNQPTSISDIPPTRQAGPTTTHGILRRQLLGSQYGGSDYYRVDSGSQFDPPQYSASQSRGGSELVNEPGGNQSISQKRVHFNDRASVRSFESISSEASNSTAIRNETSTNQSPYSLARHQIVTSPDSSSICSSNMTGSRMSAESPDLRGLKPSEAAIYAVRGDPELDDPPQSQLVESYMPSTNPIPQSYPSSHLSPQLGQPFIRMTALPTIGQSTLRPGPSVAYGMPVPGGSHPTSEVRTRVPLRAMGVSRSVDDDEDLNYILRLRQANSRVFNQYHYQPSQMSPQAQAHQNRRSSTGNIDPSNLQTEV